MKKFDIIMPVYGQQNLVNRCIASLTKHSRDYRLWVIENPHPKPEKPLVDLAMSGPIHHWDMRENIGYVKSINVGLALSTAPYVVLLNSDTEVMTEGWLEKMAEAFEGDQISYFANPKLGMVGPATDRQQQGLAGTLLKNTGPHDVEPSMTPHGILDVKLWFWCIMLRREAIVDVGYLDERFSPGGGEDDDWLIRAYSRGWKAAIQTDVLVKHVGQASWPSLEPLSDRTERAHRLLREKYDPCVHELCATGH